MSNATDIINDLASALELLIECIEPPAPDCSCHIAPPCGDCTEYGGVREAIESARSAIARATNSEETA